MDEIKSLQAEITSLISQRNLYKQKYEELQAKHDAEIRVLKRERDKYKKTCIKFAEQLQDLTKHNARNAGRKKFDKKWSERYMKFSILMDQNKSMEAIMEELDISRATYFRFKKVYKNDLKFDKPQEPKSENLSLFDEQ